jgi:hypothetical protein
MGVTVIQKEIFDTNITFMVHSKVQRPWGWECRVAIFDDEDNHVHSMTCTWPRDFGKPTLSDLRDKVLPMLQRYRDELQNPEPDPLELEVMERGDLLQLLIDRGYLQQGDKLSDLPDLTPATVEKPIWRKVWDYLVSPA